MESWRVVREAESNARLLRDLIQKVGASDVGKISNFFEVAENWRCPCCHRSKEEFARLDKNRNLLCELHRHHDHFGDEANARLPLGSRFEGLIESFCRFPDTLVCSDCNVAEPVAKSMVGAPGYFSFAPFEIATFINVRVNLPHIVDDVRAKDAYEAAKPAMLLIRNRLKSVLLSIKQPDGGFEQVGGPAWRVLKDIRSRMKDAG